MGRRPRRPATARVEPMKLTTDMKLTGVMQKINRTINQQPQAVPGARGSVFISYSSVDEATVEQLSALLRGAGMAPWWAKHLQGGERFGKAIIEAIDGAIAAVVLWSAASVEFGLGDRRGDTGFRAGQACAGPFRQSSSDGHPAALHHAAHAAARGSGGAGAGARASLRRAVARRERHPRRSGQRLRGATIVEIAGRLRCNCFSGSEPP